MDFLMPIIDHMEDALVVTDSHGKILLFNKKAFDLSHRVLIQPLSKDKLVEHCLAEPRKEIVREVYRNITLKKKPERSFAEYVLDDHATLYLEFSYIPILNKDTVEQVLMFIRDVTQQKVFEKKLVNNIENTQYLIEAANAMVIGLDTRGYVTSWNACCTQITGYEKNDVYARKFGDLLISTEAKNLFREALQRALANEEIKQCDLPLKGKMGESVQVLTSLSPRYSTTKEIIGIILVAQDITELTAYRKSLEQQVQLRTKQLQDVLKREQAAVELKSRFVSMASHEFRTPLNTLKFNIQKLEDSQINNDVRPRISMMGKQVDHMLYLLDDFLSYNKQEPSKIKLNRAPVAIRSFVEKLCKEVCGASNSTHKLLITWEGNSEMHCSDEKLLRSIVTNLLTNAIKFSPGGESVAVLLKNTVDCLEITVVDQGIGMNRRELEKVFEPFSRGEQVADIPGTGLGLSIVSRAVSLLHGEIDIKSQPEAGTRVLIRLPNIV
ncbi:MAG: PAS domain-containing sensor histidine kinase [Cyclobacteriaceae bacterium]|nr:PAS domain-containing sensor histidine kinase [Cyclobacteriaceae bacterium]